jgi:hypothetical protein
MNVKENLLATKPRQSATERGMSMIKTFRLVTHVFPALAFVAALTPAAHAGCGDVSSLQLPFVFADSAGSAQAFMRATGTGGAPAISASSGSGPFNTATIVGMWNIQFISKGNTAHNPSIPDGALLDFGYTQWHGDGTELMNSGGHAANTGNFCMGTFVRTGLFTYVLNHFALSYDPVSGNLTAKVHILEQVTLDPSGNAYSGTLTIDAYDPKSGTQLDHVSGTVSATRVTVDQVNP